MDRTLQFHLDTPSWFLGAVSIADFGMIPRIGDRLVLDIPWYEGSIIRFVIQVTNVQYGGVIRNNVYDGPFDTSMWTRAYGYDVIHVTGTSPDAEWEVNNARALQNLQSMQDSRWQAPNEMAPMSEFAPAEHDDLARSHAEAYRAFCSYLEQIVIDEHNRVREDRGRSITAVEILDDDVVGLCGSLPFGYADIVDREQQRFGFSPLLAVVQSYNPDQELLAWLFVWTRRDDPICSAAALYRVPLDGARPERMVLYEEQIYFRPYITMYRQHVIDGNLPRQTRGEIYLGPLAADDPSSNTPDQS